MNATATAPRPLAPFTLEGCKSYATPANLDKALATLGFDSLPRLHCQNEQGRFTAVFFGPDANAVIFQGFKWVFGYDRKS